MTGGARVWLRAEGGVVLLLTLVIYAAYDYSWILFAAIFFLPDLSLAGYLAGPRVGAMTYNAVHSYAVPLAGVAACMAFDRAFIVPLVWIAHVGFDRALGYGLKYPSAFGHTHLGPIGRSQPGAS